MKIHEKLMKPMFPTDQDLQDEDFVQFVPFDLYEGANFKLKIKKQGDFPNYDDSELARQSAVAGGDDDKIAKIMESTHLLSEFLDRKLYPTNEEVIAALGHELNIPLSEVKEEPKKDDKADDGPVFGFQEEPPFTPDEPKEAAKPEAKVNEEPKKEDVKKDDTLDADAEFFKNLR